MSVVVRMPGFKATTSISLDYVSFKELSEASDEALDTLATMMRTEAHDIAWPRQG